MGCQAQIGKQAGRGAPASGYLHTFRERFGPEPLAKIDGIELLETMHNHGNRDSLVYWLEFKNDEEFATPRFGSIAGGSALKFAIFFRKDANSWMGRSPGNVPIEITTEEAVARARKHRDQLLSGVELLRTLPERASDEEYERLQAEMKAKVPDVGDLAWGHKYFSLLFPDKLDDFHNADLQRFHLIKLLQLPPDKNGRYVLAGWYVDIAGQLAIQMNQMTAVLNARHGRQHRYWRIGITEDGKTPAWPAMKEGNYVAIGWPALGDLSHILASHDLRSQIKNLLTDHYANAPQVISKSVGEIARFVKEMDSGDLVVVANGNAILGIGRVESNGEYRYDPTDAFPHRRAVSWLDTRPWNLPEQEASPSTFHDIRIRRNLIAIERRIFSEPSDHRPELVHVGAHEPTVTVPRLGGVAGRIQEILDRKSQVILSGPPGTGKTHWAEKTARHLAAYREYGEPFDKLTESSRSALDEFVRTCTFHPAYGYEDFLEGYRPTSVNGQLVFEIRNGIFKRLCEDASRKSGSNFYLIIDEINRGDIPRIFGELLTVLEKSKRGKSVHLAVSGAVFRVPPNVFIIGTMNTADRSIALLDKALRRRFGFIECMPDTAILNAAKLHGLPLGPWLESINRSIRQNIGRDARNLQIGHSYLLEGERPITDFPRFVQVLRDEIIPLLEDYCYEDYTALAASLALASSIKSPKRSDLNCSMIPTVRTSCKR